MAGRMEVESALLARGAVVMTLLSIVDVHMMVEVVVVGISVKGIVS